MIIKKNRKAFTLLEIMVVIIIIGAIAGFAIPNYTKTIERAHLRDAIMQLEAIHAANNLYRSRTGSYWPVPVADFDLASINDNLGVNIIGNGMDYFCRGAGDGSAFLCWADRQLDAPKNFHVQVTNLTLDETNPLCTANCP